MHKISAKLQFSDKSLFYRNNAKEADIIEKNGEHS